MQTGRVVSFLLGVAFVACSGARVGGPEGRGPGVTFPASFAEGDQRDGGAETPSASAARDGGARDVGPPRTGYAPDPEPLMLAEQWAYVLHLRDDAVHVASVERRVLDSPRVTARKMGRYAIELWIGRELVDRVRFDFPLVASEAPRQSSRRPLHEPPTFSKGLDIAITVLVPASPRAIRAVLIDRATGATRPLLWPPDNPIEGPHRTARDADASPGDSGS